MKKIKSIREYLLSLQADICKDLSKEDGRDFSVDTWSRDQGGDGITCTLEGGDVIERGGVNFSHVSGGVLPVAASTRMPELAGAPFEALGVSLVIHPRNPFVPTVHANSRFFIAETDKGPVWWFGGGQDLTPYYPFFRRLCSLA